MTTINRTSFASGAGLSRRALLAGAGATGLALAGGRRVFAAGADNTLKVGFISPRTGALGGFGETDGYVLDVARKSLASGLSVGGKTYEVKILDQDTQSDPSRAGQLAKALINSDKIDSCWSSSTPETINPVADACEAAGVPCLSTVMPWEAWYFGRGAKPGAPSPFKWTYHFGFGVEEFHKIYVSQWNLLPTNKKVGVLYPNDADGNAIRAASRARCWPRTASPSSTPAPTRTARPTFPRRSRCSRGKSARSSIRFRSRRISPPSGARRRSRATPRWSRSARSPRPACSPTASRRSARSATIIANAAYWHKAFPYKSSLTGVSGVELADGYEKSSGKQWTQQLGASAVALFDAGFAALKESGDATNKEAVAKAIATLNTTTIAGKVDFTSGPVPNVASGPDHRHAMGEGAGGEQVQARLRRHRARRAIPTCRSAASCCRTTAERKARTERDA